MPIWTLGKMIEKINILTNTESQLIQEKEGDTPTTIETKREDNIYKYILIYLRRCDYVAPFFVAYKYIYYV